MCDLRISALKSQKSLSQDKIKVCFRFFRGLNVFLKKSRRYRIFPCSVKGHPAIKDTIEALGVPHVEVGSIFVNRRSVDFSYQLQDQDHILVYPQDLRLPPKKKGVLSCLPPDPLKFVLDSHLGKLMRHLRLLGFDTVYRKDFPDEEIVRIAKQEKRIVLTRDVALLKNKVVRYGYWVRSPDPTKQIKEILRRYKIHLKNIKPFRLCLECNGKIKPIAMKKISDRLPPLVREYYRRFFICRRCRKIYWQGSHYENLVHFIQRLADQ